METVDPFLPRRPIDRAVVYAVQVMEKIAGGGKSVRFVSLHPEAGIGSSGSSFSPAATMEGDSTDGDPASEESDAADRPSSAAHVLVVDDEQHVVELEAVRLQRLGYRVTTCTSGDAALETIVSAPDQFDLVLTDYVMPGLNGRELTEELRSRGYNLPVVVMSGFSAQASKEEITDAGAETLLKKPVSTQALRDTLEGVL